MEPIRTVAINRVLVFPRTVFKDVFSLLSWDAIQDQIDTIEASFSWLDRSEAELSDDWVQAIPCALIRDDEGRCCVLKRTNHESRDDLKWEIESDRRRSHR